MAAGSGTASFPATLAGDAGKAGSKALGVLGILWNVVSAYKTDKELTRNFTHVYSVIQQLTAVTVKFMIAELWWVAHVAAAVSDVDVNAQKISRDIGTITDNEREAWSLFLNDKLPADLQSLYDQVLAYLDAKGKGQQASLQKELDQLRKLIRALEQWKDKTATPELREWTRYYGDWKKTYAQPTRTLITWLKSPNTFAKWATSPVMLQLPSTLRDKASLPAATAIEQALVETWQNDSNRIFQLALKWLVTDS